jgi:hypothetical protein
MLQAARAHLLERLGPDEVVLDIGGWADPFERADWVVDLMPYATRGAYRRQGWSEERPEAGPERFSERTWIQRDVCDREPLPFDDGELDFVVCSHTLEDIRDPVWVCSEMQRIARAGYIEVPSRLEEQSWGVAGEFVGWTHHGWLIDVGEDAIEFVFKPHSIHGDPAFYFPYEFSLGLEPAERVQSLWWQGSFAFGERVLADEDETASYLAGFVGDACARRGYRRPAVSGSLGARVRTAAAELRRRSLGSGLAD